MTMSQVSELIHAARFNERQAAQDNYSFFYGALAQQHGERCAKCGAIGKMQIDHIQPVAQFGPSELWNLQLLCARCNGAKGNRMKDYRAGRELPPPPEPLTTIGDDIETEARRLLFLLDKCELPIRQRHNVDALRRKRGDIGIYEFAKVAATAARFNVVSADDAARVKARAQDFFEATLPPQVREEMEAARAPKPARRKRAVVEERALEQSELFEEAA